MLAVQDVFDNIELKLDGRRRLCRSVTFEGSENLIGFVVATFSDKETRGVREEWT
jgi:hypothetical protein